jgi:hypothetical protein
LISDCFGGDKLATLFFYTYSHFSYPHKMVTGFKISSLMHREPARIY